MGVKVAMKKVTAMSLILATRYGRERLGVQCAKYVEYVSIYNGKETTLKFVMKKETAMSLILAMRYGRERLGVQSAKYIEYVSINDGKETYLNCAIKSLDNIVAMHNDIARADWNLTRKEVCVFQLALSKIDFTSNSNVIRKDPMSCGEFLIDGTVLISEKEYAAYKNNTLADARKDLKIIAATLPNKNITMLNNLNSETVSFKVCEETKFHAEEGYIELKFNMKFWEMITNLTAQGHFMSHRLNDSQRLSRRGYKLFVFLKSFHNFKTGQKHIIKLSLIKHALGAKNMKTNDFKERALKPAITELTSTGWTINTHDIKKRGRSNEIASMLINYQTP